jgi:hypothetical protein
MKKQGKNNKQRFKPKDQENRRRERRGYENKDSSNNSNKSKELVTKITGPWFWFEAENNHCNSTIFVPLFPFAFEGSRQTEEIVLETSQRYMKQTNRGERLGDIATTDFRSMRNETFPIEPG